MNASTATIYRHADDHAMTEAAGEIGEGFSVDVATAWEHELVRFGLGGAQLDGRWFSTRSRRSHGTFHRSHSRGGRQKFSWIHIDDVVGIIRFVRDRSDISGVINVVAPGVSDNRTLTLILRLVSAVPLRLPAPR